MYVCICYPCSSVGQTTYAHEHFIQYTCMYMYMRAPIVASAVNDHSSIHKAEHQVHVLYLQSGSQKGQTLFSGLIQVAIGRGRGQRSTHTVQQRSSHLCEAGALQDHVHTILVYITYMYMYMYIRVVSTCIRYMYIYMYVLHVYNITYPVYNHVCT